MLRQILTGLKAMLHEAIFLATRSATMTNKNLSSCRGGVTRLQLLTLFATCNAYNNKQDGGRHLEIPRERKMSSDWPILTKLRCELQRRCHTQATCLATLRKVEGRSTFLATRKATIAVAKWGITCEFFSRNLQRNVCCDASCKKNCLV